MHHELFPIIYYTLGLFGLLFTVCGGWFGAIALLGLKKRRNIPLKPARTKFAVVAAARNEEEVICQLVESLKAQNYPAELYDIIVAPNNCTDNTLEVARAAGARIFNPTGHITCKGDVMQQLMAVLLREGQYDAVCVFDADNLVHPNFLARMNDAAQNGIRVAQGYRESKNPTDSGASNSSSMGYWTVNRYYNGSREALNLASLVHGCGFMVSCQLLCEMGGWHTTSLTEDYELTAQCVLAGEQVHYVQEAIFYDEQALTFRQNWKQRRRCSVGYVQVAKRYFFPLVKKAIREKSMLSLDMAITVGFPMLQPFMFLVNTAYILLYIYGAITGVIPLYMAINTTLAMLLCMYLGAMAMAVFILVSCGKTSKGLLRGVVVYGLVQFTSLPLAFIAVFKKDMKWEEIGHSRGVSLKDMEA